tara:strand:+ start:215 stop:355 length:141 start_codon:yes stop_codon:yes gene_type:complete
MTLDELRKALNDLDIEYMIKKENTHSEDCRGNLVTVRFLVEDKKEG